MLFVALALVAVLTAGCPLPPPQGEAPLRYRDAVFTKVKVKHDLTYGSAPDNDGNPVALKLDLYQPKGDTAARRPAVIWAHGGAFNYGSRTDADMVEISNAFAKAGYVAVSISYRLLAPPGCEGEEGGSSSECAAAAIAGKHDAQAAVRWLRRNAGTHRIDPNRIAIGGYSAGGIMALLVGSWPEDPGNSGNPGYNSAVGAAVTWAGGLPFNPFISRGDAPTIFFHGTKDILSPFAWAQSNYNAMRAAGVTAVFNAINGAGHVLWPQHKTFITTQSKYFLYYMLDLANAKQSGAPAAGRATADRLNQALGGRR